LAKNYGRSHQLSIFKAAFTPAKFRRKNAKRKNAKMQKGKTQKRKNAKHRNACDRNRIGSACYLNLREVYPVPLTKTFTRAFFASKFAKKTSLEEKGF